MTLRKSIERAARSTAALSDRAKNKYGLGEVSWENYLDNAAWVRRQRLLIDAVQKPQRYDHGYDNVPVTQLDRLGRFCRLRAVREDREARIRLNEIIASLKEPRP